MAMVPVMLQKSEKKQRAYYVVNVLVHPGYNGKGLFARMIKAAMAHVEKEGAALMGHPNDMAIKQWMRSKMHFHNMLRPKLALPDLFFWRYKVKKAIASTDLEPVRGLLEKINSESNFWRVQASSEYLTWRYLQHPSNNYFVQIVLKNDEAFGIQISKSLKPG